MHYCPVGRFSEFSPWSRWPPNQPTDDGFNTHIYTYIYIYPRRDSAFLLNQHRYDTCFARSASGRAPFQILLSRICGRSLDW